MTDVQLHGWVEEFCHHAANLLSVTGGNRKHFKESESYVSKLRGTPEHAFVVCVTVVSQLQSTMFGAHQLLASQTLSYVARRKTWQSTQIEHMWQIISALCLTGISPTNPVAAELCRTLATMVLLADTPCTEGWLAKVTQRQLPHTDNPNLGEMWIRYILAIVSALPESCMDKDVINNWCNARNQNSGKSSTQPLVARALLVSYMLTEVPYAIEIVNYASSCENSSLPVPGTLCCVAWIELAKSILERKMEVPEDHLAMQAALRSLSQWLQSSMLSSVLQWLSASITISNDGASNQSLQEAGLQLLESLCACTVPEDIYRDSADVYVNSVINDLSQHLGRVLLPSFPAILSVATATAGAAAQPNAPASVPEQQLSGYCAMVEKRVSCIADCTVALLSRAATTLVPEEGGQNSVNAVNHLSEVWRGFVVSVVTALEGHVVNMSACGWEGAAARIRLVVESSLPLAVALVESILTLSAPPHATEAVQTLQQVVGTAVERLILLAVQATVYRPHAVEDLQDSEDHEQFRNLVRDTLRDLVAKIPSLGLWAVQHAQAAVVAYDASLAHICDTNSVEAVECAKRWPPVEAFLHALSAITKPILSLSGEETERGVQLRGAVQQFVVCLSRSDACAGCRPLARMAVVLYAEFLPMVISPGAGDMERMQLQATIVKRLFSSLLHAEPTAAPSPVSSALQSDCGTLDSLSQQGAWLPFRVKQDHIGAVSIRKVMTSLSPHLAGAPGLHVQLPLVLEVVTTEASLTDKIKHACTLLTTTQHGNMTLASLQIIVLAHWLDHSRHLTPARQRALSDASLWLLVEALLESSAAAGAEQLSAMVVPVACALYAVLRRLPSPLPATVSAFIQLLGRKQVEERVLAVAHRVAEKLSEHLPAPYLVQVLSAAVKFAAARPCVSVSGSEADGLLLHLGAVEVCLALWDADTMQHRNEEELRALGAFLASCAHIGGDKISWQGLPQPAAQQVVRVLTRVRDALPIKFVSFNAHLLPLVVLPTASELIRTLNTMTPQLPVQSLWDSVVQDVSVVAQSELELHGLRSAALVPLLVFWSQCVGQAGGGVVQAIVSIVCMCGEIALQVSSGGGADISQKRSVEMWRLILRVLCCALGELSGAAGVTVPLDKDGAIPAAALTNLKAPTQSCGSHELVRWLLEQGIAVRIAQLLLRCLVASVPPASAPENAAMFPSELRDSCVGVLVKLLFCIGAEHCAVVLLAASTNVGGGAVSPAIGTGTAAQQWAQRVVQYASVGDWKKFKSNFRMLCK